MASIKPSVPKGTRDFSPTEMVKRNYIFDTIKSVFRKYGYQQIETPTMENSSTLLGKYGEEGEPPKGGTLSMLLCSYGTC
jgi:histidyl-tRNA synthetase